MVSGNYHLPISNYPKRNPHESNPPPPLCPPPTPHRRTAAPYKSPRRAAPPRQTRRPDGAGVRREQDSQTGVPRRGGARAGREDDDLRGRDPIESLSSDRGRGGALR